MKQQVLMLVLCFTLIQGLYAQEYLVNFIGSGESTTVESVEVKNLTSGEILTMSGDGILSLSTATDINSSMGWNSDQVKIYPNPILANGNSILQFSAPQSGDAVISIFDIAGKTVLERKMYFDISQQQLQLGGLSRGFYVISIRGNNYNLSNKIISTNPSNQTIRLENVSAHLEARNEGKKEMWTKNTSNTYYMNYQAGDKLKFTGSYGYYSTVLVEIVEGDKTIEFDFVSCADIDGNDYSVVAIGNQLWMAENLRTTKYPDGTLISDGTNDDLIDFTEKYYFYLNDLDYINEFGLLYSWSGATNGISSDNNPSTVQGVCPDGWHLPSKYEWTQLITYLGGEDVGGAKLKETGTNYWNFPNLGATNESGFSARAGGLFFYQTAYRNLDGYATGGPATFWTATENIDHVDLTTAFNISLDYNSAATSTIDNTENKGDGFSVRCLKDNQKNEEAFPGVEGEIIDFIVDGDTITCEFVNGLYVYQGDIILTEDQLASSKGNVIPSLAKRWTDGIVYYLINDNLPQETQEFIESAFKDYESKTILTFVERTDENNYIEFVNSETLGNIMYGTCSNLGMIGGKQRIWLEPSWNSVGTIIHEIGHAIALEHEHNRYDRDDYVEIIWARINPIDWKQYRKSKELGSVGDFDFNSIMLYSSGGTDKPKILMKINNGYVTGTIPYFANRDELGEGDIETIQILYNGHAPVAAFIASKSIINVGDTIQFTDQSTNIPKTWAWDFGDGETSIEQNPTHSYNKVGSFTVTLRVSNEFDSDIEVKTGYISVNEHEILFNPNMTYGSLTDVDGNIYKTIEIEDKIWMAENLRTTKFNDGTQIPHVPLTAESTWGSVTTPAYCYYLNDETSYKNIYGALYNSYSVETGLLCPNGWHVPTDDEWTHLTTNIVGADSAGGKLKEVGHLHWSSWNVATNELGFTALPGGFRGYANTTFAGIGDRGYWWASTHVYYGSWNYYSRSMSSLNIGITRLLLDRRSGLSVRCIKD